MTDKLLCPFCGQELDYLAEYIYNKTAQALGYLKYKPRKLNKRKNNE